MFQKPKKNKNQNQKNNPGPGNVIRDEQNAEESLLNIGNEAVGRLDGFPNLISNEANNNIAGNDDNLTHYAENDLNNYA